MICFGTNAIGCKCIACAEQLRRSRFALIDALRARPPVLIAPPAGASRRDQFLFVAAQALAAYFREPARLVFDHDFGLHIFECGHWRLELRNTEEFPDGKCAT